MLGLQPAPISITSDMICSFSTNNISHKNFKDSNKLKCSFLTIYNIPVPISKKRHLFEKRKAFVKETITTVYYAFYVKKCLLLLSFKIKHWIDRTLSIFNYNLVVLFSYWGNDYFNKYISKKTVDLKCLVIWHNESKMEWNWSWNCNKLWR